MAIKGILPYLIKKDPQDEELDGVVAAEDPRVGNYASAGLPLRLLTR